MPQATGRSHFQWQGQRGGQTCCRITMTSVAQANNRATSTEAWQFFLSANFEVQPSKPKESAPRKHNKSPPFISSHLFDHSCVSSSLSLVMTCPRFLHHS